MIAGTLSLTESPPAPSGNNEISRILQQLLNPINSWVKGHKANVSEGYLVPEPDGLMLYVVGRRDAFDFELGEELSELSVRLAEQGIDLDTTLLPAASPEELTAYFDSSRGPAIRIPAE
jgi:hypothetical protein